MAKRFRRQRSPRWAAPVLVFFLIAAAAADEIDATSDDTSPAAETGSASRAAPAPNFALPAAYGAPAHGGGPYAPPYFLTPPYTPDIEAPYDGHPNHYAPYAPDVCRYDRLLRSPLSGKLWFRGTILGWDSKGQTLPALATTSVAANPNFATAGELGRVDTNVLFGGGEHQGDFRPGGGVTLGMWFTPEQIMGVEMSWLGLDVGTESFLADSQDFPVLARPFFNVATGVQDAQVVAFPGLLEGILGVELDTEFSAAGVWLRRALRCSPMGRLDLVAGYRHAYLSDRLSVGERLFSLDAASGFAAGTEIERFDNFALTNKFHGGEIGLGADFYHGRWRLDLLGKIAMGGVHQRATLAGETLIAPPVGAISIADENLLVRESNIGAHGQTDSAMIYELNAMIEYDITCQWTVGVGYTFFYWDRVARVGDVIDTGVDFGAGATRPAFNFTDTDFWAQGLTFRFEYLF